MGIFDRLFPPKRPTIDDPPELLSLLEQSMDELKIKTQAHVDGWGLGSFDRWDFSQDDGLLVFSNDDGLRAECPAQIVGSYSTADESWLWAWANTTLDEPLTLDSRALRDYGEERGYARLTTAKWWGEEADAWHMAALAVKLRNAQGAYRGPAGLNYVFFTFGEIRLSRASE